MSDNLKKAAKTALNLLTAPQFTAFILLTWLYQLGLDLLVAISNPSWTDINVWIIFGKRAIQDSITLFLAALSKILRAAYGNETDEIKAEMTVISKATLSLMNKALISNDTTMRDYALSMGAALVTQGVSIYDYAFKGNTCETDAKVSAVIADMQVETKK